MNVTAGTARHPARRTGNGPVRRKTDLPDIRGVSRWSGKQHAVTAILDPIKRRRIDTPARITSAHPLRPELRDGASPFGCAFFNRQRPPVLALAAISHPEYKHFVACGRPHRMHGPRHLGMYGPGLAAIRIDHEHAGPSPLI